MMSSWFRPQFSLVTSLLSIFIPIYTHAQSPSSSSSSSTGITSTPIESSSQFSALFIVIIIFIFVIAAYVCTYIRYRRNLFQRTSGTQTPAPIGLHNGKPKKKRHLTGDAPISDDPDLDIAPGAVGVISGNQRTVAQEQQIAAEVEAAAARAGLKQFKAATPELAAEQQQQQRSRKLSQLDKTPYTGSHKVDTRIDMDQLYIIGEGSSHAISHGSDEHSNMDVHRTRVRMSISTPGEIAPVSHIGENHLVKVDVTPEVVRDRTGPTPRHFI